ncbi:hypothetical protein J6590_000061 [Homalodisca vitripennis]|nr:hypothetical protein J6590_000061 [Homalodisca vitripennis]
MSGRSRLLGQHPICPAVGGVSEVTFKPHKKGDSKTRSLEVLEVEQELADKECEVVISKLSLEALSLCHTINPVPVLDSFPVLCQAIVPPHCDWKPFMPDGDCSKKWSSQRPIKDENFKKHFQSSDVALYEKRMTEGSKRSG